jgi:hypothetical protein
LKIFYEYKGSQQRKKNKTERKNHSKNNKWKINLLIPETPHVFNLIDQNNNKWPNYEVDKTSMQLVDKISMNETLTCINITGDLQKKPLNIDHTNGSGTLVQKWNKIQ